MKTAGIIAEYNPFHAGHKYQIDYLKEKKGADYVISVMSGDYVQRGAPALLPKHIRTRMALDAGADLVLELPAALSTASAEAFAGGGTALLDGIGVTDMLCFGSEDGRLSVFMEVSRILAEEPEAFRTEMHKGLKNGLSFPAARQRALSEYLRESGSSISGTSIEYFLSRPNNILGLEYCKALMRMNSSIKPVTIKRIGAGYHDTEITDEVFPSASGIRNAVRNGELPPDLNPHLTDSVSRGAFVLEEDFDLLLQYCLLTETLESLKQYADVSEDLARRIMNCRNRYTGFLPFALLLKTRELTLTRIQRALLHIVLHIREIPDHAPYARVLGFRESASPLLREIKKRSRLPLITKPADAPSRISGNALDLFEETARASNIYEGILCHKTRKPFLHEYEKPVIIL